jgi:cytochrome c peroxidase
MHYEHHVWEPFPLTVIFGASRASLRRNAPTVLNAAAQTSAHWIGNRIDVEDQAKQSVIGSPSFGMPSYGDVERTLKEIKGYAPLFKQAFPKDQDPITVDNFARAVWALEWALVTPSPFDAFLKGRKEALNAREKKGLAAFMDAGCSMCHSGPYVGGQTYERFGIKEPYWKYTKSGEVDDGRFVITKDEWDKYVFKVPLLRNVAKTSPYFHDGSVDLLETAQWTMAKVQLGEDLSTEDLADILAFLQSLTGTIPEDALSIPLVPSME